MLPTAINAVASYLNLKVGKVTSVTLSSPWTITSEVINSDYDLRLLADEVAQQLSEYIYLKLSDVKLTSEVMLDINTGDTSTRKTITITIQLASR